MCLRCVVSSPSVVRPLLIFHRNLRDSKCPQLSRTLLSILADLNNTFVWMVSARSLISNFFSLFTMPLGLGSFRVHRLRVVSLSPSCSVAFLVLWQGLSTCLSFCVFFEFHYLVCQDGKVHYSLTITKSAVLAGIRLSDRIWKSERTLRISFTRTDFWFAYIPFVCMVKFQFLAQFPVDHLPHPAMS